LKKKIVLALLLAGLLPAMLSAHQFYISITNINHDKESEKLANTSKIFVNDLEESIFQEQGVRVGLWKNQPIQNAQSYVAQYVESKFCVSINERQIPLKFVSQRVESADIIEDHVIICKLEASDVPEISVIKVRNLLLTETIDSPANLVNVLANDTRKAMNIDKRIPEDQNYYR